MLFVYFKSPFGAFRIHQSIETPITADFLTHSAAYGLLLGLAGIERERKDDFKDARIAIGVLSEKLPKHETVYQQLHLATKEVEAPFMKNARPVVREFLIGLEGYIGLNHHELEPLVTKGIDEPHSLHCWGIPFMGDNNFFVERIRVEEPQPCRWFCQFEDNKSSQGERLHYLSVWTDYEDSANSKGLLFALKDGEMTDGKHQPPDKAWVSITGS
ncbi:MAG: hypothetical protein ACR2G4_06635 [Pyrinomonadaceae bacterium]